MADVIVGLWQQAATQQRTVSASQTWVPTVATSVSGGLLLPAPITIQIPTTGIITLTGVQPCDGTAGWCWHVTTTVDGVIRDQRYVLVPASTQDFDALVQVRPTDLHNLNADQVWVGLEDNPPPPLFRGWWLVSAPGNPALGADTGSGDLRRVL